VLVEVWKASTCSNMLLQHQHMQHVEQEPEEPEEQSLAPRTLLVVLEALSAGPRSASNVTKSDVSHLPDILCVATRQHSLPCQEKHIAPAQTLTA
jgi:hypothetical protein